MPSLRDYRDRIKSVKSTKKITSAMKMVAASKLRRAQMQAEASHPYAQAIANMMARVSRHVVVTRRTSKLLTGTGSDQRHVLIVMTADRGLCGGFNSNLIREARRRVYHLLKDGKDVQLICVGRKAREFLARDFDKIVVKTFDGLLSKKHIDFADADVINQMLIDRFEAGVFDVCSIIYNEFVNVLTQTPTCQQIIPFNLPELEEGADDLQEDVGSIYDFDPNEEEILNKLLPRNVAVQIYRAMLDSAAGEQAARMSAMDNATRNAGDMINDLTLQYNRARQAYITKELIEIISGAEAL